MWDPGGEGERMRREKKTRKRLLVYDSHVQMKGLGKKGDADFEALISIRRYSSDAHEQDAFSSRVTHRRSFLQKQIVKQSCLPDTRSGQSLW